MNAHARIHDGVLGLVALGSVACVKPLPTEEPTPTSVEATTDTTTEPTDGAPAPPDEVEPLEPETVDLDWEESPLQADLDGDGAPESITWSCGGTLRLVVGRARVSEEYQLVEEMGCVATVVALRPGDAARQLAIAIAEHDEVGPGLCFLYEYRDGKLELLWSDKAAVDFLVDGSWTTETSDCYETRGYRATLTGRHRWDGKEVTSEADESRTPVGPEDCSEP